MLSNTLRLNFSYLKIIDILHSRYPPKITGNIPKKKQKTMFLYSWNYTMNHDKNEDENEKWIMARELAESLQ